MALTEAQRVLVRLYTGWQDGFGQFDSRLEQAMNHVDNRAELLALVTNLATDTPPGLLAQLALVDSRIFGSHGRLKASAVGSITLNPGELQALRSEGRRLVGRLCSILGVERGADVFGGSGPSGRAGGYVGK